MRKICSICHQSFILNAEEEELEEAGFLSDPICDDCYDNAEISIHNEEDINRNDADNGL